MDALAGFADNREALEKDPTASAALAELEKLKANSAPYGQVNHIEALVASVEKVNEGLAGERRENALLSIGAKLKEATGALDVACADADFLYISADGGEAWKKLAPAGDAPKSWTSVTVSSNGKKLAACATDDFIYSSTDAGATWTVNLVPAGNSLPL